jgi:hypothetical protein
MQMGPHQHSDSAQLPGLQTRNRREHSAKGANVRTTHVNLLIKTFDTSRCNILLNARHVMQLRQETSCPKDSLFPTDPQYFDHRALSTNDAQRKG